MFSLIEGMMTTVILEAAKPMIDRLKRHVAKRGYGSVDIFAALERNPGPHTSDYWPASLLYHLPVGVTQKQINEFVSTPQFAACARQMIALKILQERDQDRQREILSSLATLLISMVSTAAKKDMESYIDAFGKHFTETCTQVANAIIDSAKNTVDVLAWAFATLTTDTLQEVKRYGAIIAGQDPTLSNYNEWVSEYLHRFISMNSEIELPDLSARHILHFDRLFVSPAILDTNSNALPASKSTRRTYTLSDFSARIDRTVLLGDPGAGKSTISRIVAVNNARAGTWVPFIIQIRDLPQSKFNLAELLNNQLKNEYQLEVSLKSVLRLLHEGRALLVFDGLDENRKGTSRSDFAKQIEAIGSYFPYSALLVTSRIIGYQIAKFDNLFFAEFFISSFSASQVSEYTEKWFAAQTSLSPKSRTNLIYDFLRTTKSMPDLLRNPLLLAFILVLYRGRKSIPRTRPHLYRQCVDLLLGEWDMRRGIIEDLPEFDVVRTALGRIAHLEYNSNRNARGLSKRQIELDLIPFLADRVVASVATAQKFVHELLFLCRGRAWMFTDVGQNELNEDLFSFTHASFQEYFAAAHMVHCNPDPKIIADHLYDFAINGEEEIYGQVCLNLFSLHSLAGASAVLSDLLNRIRRDFQYAPTDELNSHSWPQIKDFVLKRTTAISYLTKASDCIPLTRDVAQELISAAVEQVAYGDVVPMGVLLESSYKHRDAVLEVLADVINEAITCHGSSSAVKYIWFAANVGYLVRNEGDHLSTEAVNCLRSLAAKMRPKFIADQEQGEVRMVLLALTGSLNSSIFIRMSSSRFCAIFESFFEAQSQPIRGLGPQSLASWVLDCFSSTERSITPVAAAAILLRGIAQGVNHHGPVLERLRVPLAVGLDLGNVRLDKTMKEVLRRACGYDEDVKLGLAYIVAGTVELIEMMSSREDTARRVFAQWLDLHLADSVSKSKLSNWVTSIETIIWQESSTQAVS